MNTDEIDEETFEKMKDYLNENNIRYTVNENRTVTIDPQDWEKWVELSHDEEICCPVARLRKLLPGRPAAN